jgi:ectoine hydroxylase-related dioxygenase (phytanoyl-CoA dioxygenase family)
VLSTEAVDVLKRYVTAENQKQKDNQLYVHNSENRYHILLHDNVPEFQQAAVEIANHKILRAVLDHTLGKHCTLVSASVITNTYGAKGQEWHYDTATSAAVYPDYIVAEYTVAVALQDTTADMGATGVCPGTHECQYPGFDYDQLEENFLKNRTLVDEWGGEFWDYIGYNLPCPIQAVMNSGDALLYNSDTIHKGSAHVDPVAGDRAVMFLVFAESRQGPDDNRMLPQGQVYALPWSSWGHTIDEFVTMSEHPWRWWHSLGLFNYATGVSSLVRPWNLIDIMINMFIHEDEEFLTWFEEKFNDLMFYNFIVIGVYLLVIVPLTLAIMLCVVRTSRKHDGQETKKANKKRKKE